MNKNFNNISNGRYFDYRIETINTSIENIRPYKVYTALLTQSGTNAPVATVLENTLGISITYSRNIAGIYILTPSSGTFNLNKTTVHIGQQSGDLAFPEEAGFKTIWVSADGTTIWIKTVEGGWTNIDGLLNRTLVEIRVYP